MKLIYKSFLLVFVMVTIFSSCKKFVQVQAPADLLSSDLVFSTDNAAVATVTGIYSQMMSDGSQFCSAYTSLFAGLSADELYYYTADFRTEFSTNEISLASHPILESGFWNPAYRYIYAANKIMESIARSKDLSQPVKDMCLGEAKFIRAFCYFHLVSFFGDIPLVLSTDYITNSHLSRTGKENVWNQIVGDLKDAENLLGNLYPTANRVRPNKYAAAALLARVYLYRKDWVNAEAQSNFVLGSGMYSLNNDLGSVFLLGSNETIWQLKPVVPNYNTWDGNLILPSSNTATPTYLLTSTLVNSFEAGDQRESAWTKSTIFSGDTLYYPCKYKVKTAANVTEYYVVLRLAEQYLIRAEARAMQGNITGAAGDLDKIRTRAGLPATGAATQSDMLAAIENERRFELFTEWGHRWFDLGRTGRANAILGSLKPATWQPTDVLWPVPQSQININPLLTQNPGY